MACYISLNEDFLRIHLTRHLENVIFKNTTGKACKCEMYTKGQISIILRRRSKYKKFSNTYILHYVQKQLGLSLYRFLDTESAEIYCSRLRI